MSAQLLSAATATNSAPSGSSAGIELQRASVPLDRGSIVVHSTAGSGTMTCTLRLWGGSNAGGTFRWYPLGTDASPDQKGVLNEGFSIGETAANTIAHAEEISGLTGFERLYLEVTAIGGTSTAISAWLIGDK